MQTKTKIEFNILLIKYDMANDVSWNLLDKKITQSILTTLVIDPVILTGVNLLSACKAELITLPNPINGKVKLRIRNSQDNHCTASWPKLGAKIFARTGANTVQIIAIPIINNSTSAITRVKKTLLLLLFCFSFI